MSVGFYSYSFSVGFVFPLVAGMHVKVLRYMNSFMSSAGKTVGSAQLKVF